MKKASLIKSIFLFLVASTFYDAPAQVNNTLKVVIIRHAEKPENGDHLSCKGQNRALQLANVLYSKFKTPDYIFVPTLKTGKTTTQARMYETIIPFSVKYNLSVNTKYSVDDAAGLANAILKKSGTIIVVWEHNNIPALAQALGIKDEMLKWKDGDFDSIWIITFPNGKPVLTRDNENLSVSSACP